MSGCEYYQELISRMPDEELSGEEKTALAEHLKDCPDCALLYDAFSGLSEMIKEDLVEAPESIRINVMAELRREEIKKKNSVKRKRISRIVAAAACLVLVFSAGFAARPKLKNENAAVAGLTMDLAAPAAAAPAAGEPEAYVEEAAPAEAAVVEMPASEEADKTEAGLSVASDEMAVSQSRFTVYSADRAEQTELLPTWEELSTVLQGTVAERANDILAEDSFVIRFTLSGEPMELEFIICDGAVFYTDPVDGVLKAIGCSLGELADFAT